MKPAEARPPARAMVWAPNWMGDAVMALPALQAWTRQSPELQPHWLARPAVAAVLQAANLPGEIIALPARASARWPRELMRQCRQARAELAILLPNSFASALAAWRLGIPQRIGYGRDGRGLWLTSRVRRPRPGQYPEHEAYGYWALLTGAGLLPAPPEKLCPELRLDAAARGRGRARLAASAAGFAVVAHAGAAYGAAKRWPPEYFALLFRQLSLAGCGITLVGTSAERELADFILARSGASGRNLAGQTTPAELLEVIAAADLVVANDSGPMHAAAALGRPVVALFGSTNERQTHPLGPPGYAQCHVLVAADISCRPCKLRQCPLDHRCMRRLRPEDVAQVIMPILNRHAAKARE